MYKTIELNQHYEFYVLSQECILVHQRSEIKLAKRHIIIKYLLHLCSEKCITRHVLTSTQSKSEGLQAAFDIVAQRFPMSS